MKNKRTLVIGASENSARYSYLAIISLLKNNYEVVALAKRTGKVFGIPIQTNFPKGNINTVTLYIGPHRQPEYYQKIIRLKPERVIFNPGAENDEFVELLEKNSIKAVEACTLMMLSTRQY